jgi:ribosomal-protein-alanine N-acetyltransferase
MKNKEITLKGHGFTIRPYRKGDYISLAKNANNKKISKNLPDSFPSPYTEKSSKEWIKKVQKMYKIGPILNFVIDIDGLAVGTIGGNIHKNKPFIVGFGYWLGEDYWRKGITSKAVKIYTKYIFKNIKKIERIQAETYPWNKGSQGVLLKNRFKLEAILRKNTQKGGKIIDEYMFSKLRNER